MGKTSNTFLHLSFICLITIFACCLFPNDHGKIVEKNIKDLKIMIGISEEEDAEFFNSVLEEEDIIFTYGAKTNLLRLINGPLISIGRQSILDLENDLERLGDISIDYLNYNPEQSDSSHTPEDELNDIFGSISEARILANQLNAKLSFGTDNILHEMYGAQIAPLVDLYGIQAQRYQTDTLDAFSLEVRKKIEIAKSGSQDVPIFIQLSLQPPKGEIVIMPNGDRVFIPIRDENGEKVYVSLSAEEVFEQIDAIKNETDGITIIYPAEKRDEMKKLVSMLRGNDGD